MMDARLWAAACPPGPGVPWTRCDCGAPIRSDGTGCTGPGRHPVPQPAVRIYATWTSTRRNLAEMHARGMRLLTGPDQLTRYRDHLPPLSWALDNGAWGCAQRGVPFDGPAFQEALTRWGPGADWVVLPDVVGDRVATLDLAGRWIDDVRRATNRPRFLAVQDGMVPADVRALGSAVDGIFVGGSTAWKWRSLPTWSRLRDETGQRLHVGRVNSARRVRLCVDLRVDSIDGTSVSRYGSTAAGLDAASRTAAHPLLF